MKLGSALAILALAGLTPSSPAVAAKDNKLPRCNGQQKRPANSYGTVLPSIPDRGAPAAGLSSAQGVPRGTPSAQAVPAPTTNLFPPEGPATPKQAPTAPQDGKVPAIGAVSSGADARAALPISYASC